MRNSSPEPRLLEMIRTLNDFLRKCGLSTLEGSFWEFYVRGNCIFIDKPDTDSILVIDLLVESGICKSKGEVRRLIQGNGVSIDDEKSTDPNWKVDITFEDWVDVKIGKKNYYRVFFI